MHENVMAWTGCCIKKKFQDTYVHHTSLAPVMGHWSHSLLLKELAENSLCFMGGAKVKIPCSHNGQGIYSQGWGWTLVTFGLPSWPFNFLWLFNWYDSSSSLCFHWTFTLHKILLEQIWPMVVMWPWQLMTQLDMTLLTWTGWMWWQCQFVVDVEWWMCSWIWFHFSST